MKYFYNDFMKSVNCADMLGLMSAVWLKESRSLRGGSVHAAGGADCEGVRSCCYWPIGSLCSLTASVRELAGSVRGRADR